MGHFGFLSGFGTVDRCGLWGLMMFAFGHGYVRGLV